jgi:hypothetical protein
MLPGYQWLARKLRQPIAQASVVGALGFGIGLNSQLPAFSNNYVINGDVPQHIYWMQQFADSELFTADLLTRFAIHIQPWGFIGLYRVLSFFADPLTLSKIVPIGLFILSILYLFFLVKHIANVYTAFLASAAFMIFPDFMLSMVGGHARAFAHPLIISFLFYLTKRSYKACAILLVLQSLFYPTAFLICAATYAFALSYKQAEWLSFRREKSIVMYFVLAVLASGMILSTKYLASDPLIGTVVTRSQMKDRPEFYSEGRVPILPTPPIAKTATTLILEPLVAGIVGQYPEKLRDSLPEFLSVRLLALTIKVFLLLLTLYLIWEIVSGRLFIPIEIAYLILSGAVLYQLADIFTFKLYLPDRYVQYTLPVALLILVCIGANHLLAQLGDRTGVKALRLLLLVAILAHFNVLKGIGLTDESRNAPLFRYLETLPKNTVIAADLYLGDFIPTFSKRKVFVNYELSHPWMDKYWDTIRARTFELFDAYYADSRQPILSFCRKHRIDYVVVDRRRFTPKFLQGEKPYFEPFNSYVKNMTRERNHFALLDIPEQHRLFSNGDIFVISVDALTT